MLYQLQWGYRKEGRRLDEYMVWAQQELRPVLKRMVEMSEAEDILVPQAVYGYWKAAADGDDLILFAPDGETEVARFSLPRQAKAQRDEEAGMCITDYVRDVRAGERDVIGLQVVTMGQRAADVARE